LDERVVEQMGVLMEGFRAKGCTYWREGW